MTANRETRRKLSLSYNRPLPSPQGEFTRSEVVVQRPGIIKKKRIVETNFTSQGVSRTDNRTAQRAAAIRERAEASLKSAFSLEAEQEREEQKKRERLKAAEALFANAIREAQLPDDKANVSQTLHDEAANLFSAPKVDFEVARNEQIDIEPEANEPSTKTRQSKVKKPKAAKVKKPSKAKEKGPELVLVPTAEGFDAPVRRKRGRPRKVPLPVEIGSLNLVPAAGIQKPEKVVPADQTAKKSRKVVRLPVAAKSNAVQPKVDAPEAREQEPVARIGAMPLDLVQQWQSSQKSYAELEVALARYRSDRNAGRPSFIHMVFEDGSVHDIAEVKRLSAARLVIEAMKQKPILLIVSSTTATTIMHVNEGVITVGRRK